MLIVEEEEHWFLTGGRSWSGNSLSGLTAGVSMSAMAVSSCMTVCHLLIVRVPSMHSLEMEMSKRFRITLQSVCSGSGELKVGGGANAPVCL